MFTDRSQRHARSRRFGALQTATLVTLVAGYGASSTGQANAAPPAAAGALQSGGDDPCRYVTAEAMGSAFRRPLKGSKLADVCQYRGTGTDLVVVKVAKGAEGTILRHARTASSQNQSGVEKVTTAVGEAYLDTTIPAFIGRIGDQEVQLETTIQPLPRDAMIAVGKRMMEAIAGK
jgi:hypothetical protein